jgi:hypothetical protein
MLRQAFDPRGRGGGFGRSPWVHMDADGVMGVRTG